MKTGRILAWLIFPAMACWAVMAIAYSNLPAGLRLAAAGTFCVLTLVGAIIPGKNRWRISSFLSLFTLVLAWWLVLPPSNNRDWQPDVAKLPSFEITGSTIVAHDIRDCDYTAEYDYVVRHYDRTLNLGSLRSMDLFLTDWGLPHIAHTMISFGFYDGTYICFSIETRKKKGIRYSSVRGFFKQYELAYIVADERDLVRLRTNYRQGEDVYLYRLKIPPERVRMIFMDYVRTVNMLRERPEWYNALTGNCTTDIWKHLAPYYPKVKFDWRILASGHADELAYELGVVDTTLPFLELRPRSLINERGKAAGRDLAFSKIIRRGLPGF